MVAFGWSEVLQATLVVLTFACLGLFVQERRRHADDARSLASMFSNPYLRVLGIALIVLVALRDQAQAEATGAVAWRLASLASLATFIIGATVVGGEFILLAIALLTKNETYIQAHFALEQARVQLQAGQPVAASPERVTTELPPETAPADGAADGRGVAALSDADRAALFAPVLEQPALAAFGFGRARELAGTAREVRVAIVGMAVDAALAEHPALADQLEPPRAAPGASLRGHRLGAAVVGYVAAATRAARLLSVAIFDESGTGSDGQSLQGLRLALDWAPHVLYMDFGGPNRSAVLGRLLARYAESVVLIAPAGNEGSAEPVWPAAEEGVLAVAATTSNGKQLAAFSSHGPHVRLAAPGADVVSLVGVSGDRLVFQGLSGTSIAAGLVTALAAMALATDPDLTPSGFEDLLIATGQPIRGHRAIRSVDAAGALERLAGRTPSNSVRAGG